MKAFVQVNRINGNDKRCEMDKQSLIKLAVDFMESSKENQIKMETDLSIDAGTKIYDAPILGFADPGDECFLTLKDPEVIGEHFMIPVEWLPSSNTVISFFLPFTNEIKKSNSKERVWPSWEWLYGRIEGQQLLNSLGLYLQTELNNAGYLSIIPSLDKRFMSITAPKMDLNKKVDSKKKQLSFTSNWSERHVAYVCGLGTFGLSKGLITSKGITGRFGSIVTDLKLEADQRTYEIFDAYCTKCGACIQRCPVQAISFEKGKDHQKCSGFLDKTREKFNPRYGCGKCQVNVSCESCIPRII